MSEIDREPFRVEQLDHVELFVPERRPAAAWYQRVFGLSIYRPYEHWADDPKGPLMISSDGGSTKLALFKGTDGGSGSGGFHLVAFRVSGRAFGRFIDRLDELELTDHLDRRVTRELVADHQQALSIYFCDPYGHRFELTTYEVEQARAALDAGPLAAPPNVPDEPAPAAEPRAGQALWMCHACSRQLAATTGVVCSLCFCSTCPDCLDPTAPDPPVCTSCAAESNA